MKRDKKRTAHLAACVAPLVIGGCAAAPAHSKPSNASAANIIDSVVASKSSIVNPVTTPPNAQTGPYASSDFPMLGAVTAICLSDEEERTKFSQSANPEKFCTQRYGLNKSQAKLLLAPASNQEVPCSPDGDQILEVVSALRTELLAKRQSTSKKPLFAKFDEHREVRYPTLSALYKAYVLGDGAAPESWEASLTAELRQHPENIW